MNTKRRYNIGIEGTTNSQEQTGPGPRNNVSSSYPKSSLRARRVGKCVFIQIVETYGPMGMHMNQAGPAFFMADQEPALHHSVWSRP